MVNNCSLEITTKIGCPLNCKFCPQNNLIKRYQTLSEEFFMSEETFKTCIDKVPSQVSIHFSGYCEPWENDNCTNMVLYAYKLGHPIQVFTTLQGMSIEDFDRIKHIPFEKFIIHLPDQEQNSNFHMNAEYHEVLRYVLDYFIIFQNDKFFGFSIHGKINSNIEKIIPKGYSTQINFLGIQQELHDRAGCLSYDELKHINLKGHIKCNLCKTLLNRNVLLPDGTVTLCCMDYGLEYIIGNLILSDYEDLFSSVMYKKVTDSMEEECSEIICRHCINASPHESDINLVEESTEIFREEIYNSIISTNKYYWTSLILGKIKRRLRIIKEYYPDSTSPNQSNCGIWIIPPLYV